ncbi:MAG TPA: YkgJ family cysteine cluster protein [Candidatus Methylomirabilis sp.]|nr:YkgJ family cysteine cluster protein [Candidatus Methylomirabilis sp.]
MPPRRHSNGPNPLEGLRQKAAEGLLFTHSRLNTNTAKTLETASFLYALVELLSEKGVISIEQLDQRKQEVGRRLAEDFKKKNMGVMLQDPEYDKYSLSQELRLDCRARLHHCRAACCRIPFALSRQDIREGIVCWSLGEPYLIEHGGDGYCIHMDRDNLGCTIYPHRPVPCRAFDCRTDGRIWLDFEKGVVNPETRRPDWPGCLTRAEASGVDPRAAGR